ncbi:spindle assembly checkpoint kinase isoform X2 [Syngnathus acus]|uniref:spindle assembly checkpoint kinase isoform X2 n=1 Tax=Syngnathus acus TaxID=161584 RepID=UPI001885D0F7|nr:spindle assembly checkpoint kinase isoform X2 [Syngnathus acus]
MAYSTGTLAQGCFGKVYRQKYDDTWAAIKKVPQHLISRKDLERECEVYNKAHHSNIVKLLGNINLKDGKWIIPLEFIFGEDLETTIFKSAKSKIQLTPTNRGKIIVGMCEGLLHLHCYDIVHQDLKPENIMVEHNTNRAVIIDLGLAKFFRRGLNSAVDMGNEAYSAPEVLQRHSQRDQRSDVWAMGKIIAELCARVRLHTPSVCPAKIQEVMGKQPYCQAVCRMVESNPTLRASMVGVIGDIRKAVGGLGHLAPPQTHVRNRSASPGRRGASPGRRGASPYNNERQAHSPMNKRGSPLGWERTPRPDIKLVHRGPRQPRSLSPQRIQALAGGGGALELSKDMMKMGLFQDATRGLPRQLPTTGRVMVRHFEEKNGEVERWAQKEVVMRDGKIVKYNNVTFNSS